MHSGFEFPLSTLKMYLKKKKFEIIGDKLILQLMVIS